MAYPDYRRPWSDTYLTLNAAIGQVGAIYWNRRDKAEEMLTHLEGAGNWQTLLWAHRANYLQPSLSMFLVSGNHVLINIAGSQNTAHWLGNVEGATSPRSYGGSTFANTFFYEMADSLYDEIVPLLPQNVGKIRIASHSLGSGCGNILANFLKAQGHNVQLLGFAEPRSVSEGFSPPHPDDQDHTRIYIGNEQVGWLPMRSLGQYFLFRRPSQIWSSNAFNWGHYGVRMDFSEAGQEVTYNNDRDDVSALAYPISNMVLFHPIGSYMRAFNAYADGYTPPVPYAPILMMNREIYNQSVDPAENNFRINPNNVLNIAQARVVLNIPEDAPQDFDLILVEWGGFEVEGTMSQFFLINPEAPQDIGIISNNMAGPTANLWKIEFLIDDAKYWFTESHVLSENLDFDGAFARADEYWEVRRTLVGRKNATSSKGGGSPACSNVRCSQVLNPKVAQSRELKNATPLGVAYDFGASCDTLNNGRLVRMHGTQAGGGSVAQGVRNWGMRAVPDALLQDGRKTAIADWDNAFILFASYLKNNPWGLLVQDQATPNDRKPITAFAQDGTTKVWTLDCDCSQWSSLDVVRVSKTSVPEMNGTYTIAKVSNSQIKLMKGPLTVSSMPITGQIQRIKKANGQPCKVFAQYDDIVIGRECDHDVTQLLKKSHS